jgi:anti-sigma factor RsiW
MRLLRRRRGLPCVEVVRLVTDYLEGALPAGEQARVDQHLAGCPHCTEFVREMRIVVAAAGAIDPPRLSGETERELLAAFRAARD